ncbi:MAG: WecB/TagA/CpsF family glycosyltransferase [Sphingomonas bacterium]|nr:WecB/TagA/CpsF family glycosyltransferase [Sphingomonas bacterium]
MPIDRVEFLGVEFDILSEHQVVDRLNLVTAETPFGYIVTPNVDHVVRLNGEGSEPALGAAYANADLCVCDSRVLALLARFRRIRLPVVTGSDLTAAMLENVLSRGDRVAVVGGSPELVRRLSDRYSHIEFVHHCPPMGLRRDVAAQTAAAQFITEAKCRFTFLAVGSPQQELIAARVTAGTGFGLCIGAALEFLTGDQVRAPIVLRRTGLEWAYRLASDPRRLWRRYLIEGPQVFLLAWRWRALRAGSGRRA